MNITEVRQANQEVVIGHKCDVCGKESEGSLPKDWHHLYHKHYDWGNDSVDSYESFDVCSSECYLARLKESVYELRNHDKSGEISDMSIPFVLNLIKFMER